MSLDALLDIDLCIGAFILVSVAGFLSYQIASGLIVLLKNCALRM
jgi:hypothetical protein